MNLRVVLFLVFLGACSSPPPPKKLTVSEQIAEDNQVVREFQNQFEKKVRSAAFPETERYLTQLAQKLARVQEGLTWSTVRVKIHGSTESEGETTGGTFYGFPGTLISVPLNAVESIEYENELAAALAYELAHVINRHLALHLGQQQGPVGALGFSVFDLDRTERLKSILLGTRLMYYAGYDLRGMASVFQHHGKFFGGLSSQNEVEFNVKEAQRHRSQYLPVQKPIVKSGEFVAMKKLFKRQLSQWTRKR